MAMLGTRRNSNFLSSINQLDVDLTAKNCIYKWDVLISGYIIIVSNEFCILFDFQFDNQITWLTIILTSIAFSSYS